MKAISENAAVWPRSSPVVLVVLVLLGAVAFVAGVAGDASLRAWQIYLVNYVFWSGVAVAGVILAAIWHVTSSIWGKAFQGVAVAGVGFLPVSLVLFVPLMLAGGTLFPWVSSPRPHRAAWMAPGFVFARDVLGLLLLFVLAGVFVYYRVRPVLGARRELAGEGQAARERASLWLGGWQGREAEQARSEHVLWRLAPVLFIVYALVLTLLAYDLINALDPHFYSTLFGAYYFFGSLYAGLAWLALLSGLLFRSAAGRGALAPRFLHPMGKLLFGFCMFHGMLFFSQYLPIWYGNLPEETEFVIVRSYEGAWPVVSIAFLLASLLLPFVILLSRAVKENPRSLMAVAGIVLVGMWLDKFVLVVPSVWHEHQFPFGLLELAVTVGFAALVLLCYWGTSRYLPLLHHDPSRLTYHH